MHLRSRWTTAVITGLFVTAIAPQIPAGAQPNRPPSAHMTVTLEPPTTFYKVTASDPDGHLLDYIWSGDLECGNFTGNYPEPGQASWYHPNGDPPVACDHEDGTDHEGTISVLVTDGHGGQVQCTHEGSGPGEMDCTLYGEEIDDCLIDMRLFDGMRGDTPIDEAETSSGAFTVLNNNDSDDRGGPDLGDNTVEGEKDLMKLRLFKPAPSAGGIVTLYFPTERVRLWKTAEKGKRIGGSPYPDFPVDALPKTIWVEGIQPSVSVRDLTFTYVYRPTGNEAACQDEAKATIISATIDGVLHDSTDTVWSDMPSRPYAALQELCGGGFGLRPTAPDPLGVRNCIGFRFQVLPPEIVQERHVVFDITRQKASESYINIPGSNEDLDPKRTRFPKGEKANDDAHDNDESESPTSSGIIFGFDGPGTRTNNSGTSDRARFFYDANFREFLRVRFDGIRPTGNVEAGTRVGPLVRWVARHSLVSTREKVWVRITGDDRETEENLVQPR